MRPERVRKNGKVPGIRPSLASTQDALLSLVTGRAGGGGGSTPWSAGALVVGDQRGSAEHRVGVYAYMYRLRMAEALESQFPRLARLLGPDAFADLSAAYVHDEPSRHPSLRYLGQRLPAWMADAARGAAPPPRVGLAQLEWARTDVFDLADESTLTLAALRSWPLERFGELPLRLIAAHRLLTVPAGTARLWDTLGPDAATSPDAAPTPASSDDATETLLVWRDQTMVYHRPVDAPEGAALQQTAVGAHFGVLCDVLLGASGGQEQAQERAVQQSYTWISTWLADGLLAALPN